MKPKERDERKINKKNLKKRKVEKRKVEKHFYNFIFQSLFFPIQMYEIKLSVKRSIFFLMMKSAASNLCLFCMWWKLVGKVRCGGERKIAVETCQGFKILLKFSFPNFSESVSDFYRFFYIFSRAGSTKFSYLACDFNFCFIQTKSTPFSPHSFLPANQMKIKIKMPLFAIIFYFIHSKVIFQSPKKQFFPFLFFSIFFTFNLILFRSI